MADTAGRFDGKVLLATGGASGLAATTARRFTAEGGRVAVVDLAADRAREVAASLPGAIALQADVSDETAVRAAVTATVDQLGRLDCVLNAAGHVTFGRIEDYPYADWQRMLAVHAGGTFLICKHAVAHLRATGAGAIVNIASIAALQAQHGNFAYGAAKGAILAFSRQLAYDVAPEVRVNVVAPGRVRTPMTEPLYVRRGGGNYDEGVRASIGGIMQKRVAEPEELAALILFLLSDDASFMTGGVHVADGGETAC